MVNFRWVDKLAFAPSSQRYQPKYIQIKWLVQKAAFRAARNLLILLDWCVQSKASQKVQFANQSRGVAQTYPGAAEQISPA